MEKHLLKRMYHPLKYPTIFLHVSYFNVIRFFLQMQSERKDERRSTYLDDSMVPDQFPHAVEHEGEAHAEHDQRENDQDYDDMLGIDQPRFLLLWGRK